MNSKTQVTNAQLEKAYRKKGALVLRRCRLILRNEDDACDMLHETFRRILNYSVDFESPEIPLSFLYRTAERCCFDLMRSKKRRPTVSDDHAVNNAPAEFACENMEMSELLNSYFESLNEKMRTLALLYFVDGLSQEQIAAEMGWSRKTVGKKLSQLKKKAQKLKNA